MARDFVPAAGIAALNRWYDLGLDLTMRQHLWRPLVVDQVAGLAPHRVLDVGSGTGTLAIALADRTGAEVVGLDPDPGITRQARAKPGSERVDWQEGWADRLAFADGSFDAVTCTLVLHHLDRDTKGAAVAEMHRVLRPGGLLVIADWGVPHGPVTRAAFVLLQLLDGWSNTDDNRRGLVRDLVADTGFRGPVVLRRIRTSLGSFEVLAGFKIA